MILARGRKRVVGRRERVGRRIENLRARELTARSGTTGHQHAAIEQRRRASDRSAASKESGPAETVLVSGS